MRRSKTARTVAIACGGTGGHLFPGLAVAEVLREKNCESLLFVSAKKIDQQVVRSNEFRTVTLPAVGLESWGWPGFLVAFFRSLSVCRGEFRRCPPAAVLAMGGFTSAAPAVAGRAMGLPVFLHESNAIPGRAIRWLGRCASEIFVGFPEAAARLPRRNATVTGTPVRRELKLIEPAAARVALGLDPGRPVLLVMGGSQGAAAINRLVERSLDELARRAPELQFIHLTGFSDRDALRQAYQAHGQRAVVLPFLTEMELALGAATAALSRAGASSLAEFAAVELPAILLPYPAAADNHQFYNARAFLETGAALQLDQASATPAHLTRCAIALTRDARARETMRAALRQWHAADAAERIVGRILKFVPEEAPHATERNAPAAPPKNDWPSQPKTRLAHG